VKRIFSCPAIAILISAINIASLPAQSPSPSQSPESAKASDKPYVEISETGWGPNGELVLAVRVHAGKLGTLLGSFGKAQRGNNSGSGSPVAFSLEGSSLEDTRSGKKITPLLTRIKKPYFGPSGTALQLAPNGWVQLGVAFPHPPSPGTNKDGQPNPYLLKYYPPEGLAPVELEIPFDKSAEAAAKAAPR
jgi:hypothetical protein